MRSLRCFWMSLVLIVAALFAAPSWAAETRMLFLRALQQSKYVDVALEYLDVLESQPDLPPLLRQTLDLERCNTYLAWARIASNPKQAEQRRTQAQAFLKKFLAAHPGHPAAAMVTSFSGSMALDRGQALLASAGRTEDAPRKASLREEGLAALRDAQKQLDEATGQYKKWLALLASLATKDRTSAAEARAERLEVEMGSAETMFKAGLADFSLAEAAEPKSDERTELLKLSAERFDAAFQQWRSFGGVASLWAHLWHARSLDEMGDSETAQDILDEVQGNAPRKEDPNPQKYNISPDFAAVYTEADLFQLRRLAKQGKTERLIYEAGDWLQTHRTWSKLPSYQGVVVELAKAQLSFAKRRGEGDHKKTLEQVAASLGNAAKVEGEYKEEAIQLRRQVLKALGTNLGAEETLALGDAAMAAREFAQATEHYRHALQAVEGKDPKQAADIRQRINRVRYAQAVAMAGDKKLDEALKAALELAQEDLADPSASRAASLALAVALAQMATASDKASAMATVEKTADAVAKRWADRPEADEAVIALGQACLLQGNLEGAMERFHQVKPASRRYSTALLIEGQIHWRAYQEEKAKDETRRDSQRMKTSRDRAQECITQAVERLKSETSLNTLESAAPLIEALNLLADVLNDSKDHEQVVAQLDPILEKIKVFRPQPLDKTAFRTFVAAVWAHMALGHLDQTAGLALTMAELADDRPEFNNTLIKIAKLLRVEFSRAQAAANENSDDAKATKHRDQVKKMLSSLAKELLKRKQYAPADMAYLGDLCTVLEMNSDAMQLYQQLVKRADDDPAFAKEAGRAIIGAKSQVVSLLRTQGKFQEAVKQSDDLIAQSPRSLEPRMAKAQILQDWAKEDSSKFAPAVAQWTEVRVMLGRLLQKPPAYYQALYHTAECLYGQWMATHEGILLGQAEQTLQSALILNSKSIPADLLPQYQELLKRVKASRERTSKK
jgi:hypothetical protein